MRNRFGFTLFDLMITIAIGGVLLGLGTPNLTHTVTQYSADANARAIWRALAKTREAAILSGELTTFCGIGSDGHCVRDDINAFLVFHDRDRNQQLSVDETAVHRIDLDFAGEVTLRASKQKHITYANNGVPKQYGSIVLCHVSKKPQYIRRVTVNPSGRTYLARDLDGDGIIASADGSPIDCGQ